MSRVTKWILISRFWVFWSDSSVLNSSFPCNFVLNSSCDCATVFWISLLWLCNCVLNSSCDCVTVFWIPLLWLWNSVLNSSCDCVTVCNPKPALRTFSPQRGREEGRVSSIWICRAGSNSEHLNVSLFLFETLLNCQCFFSLLFAAKHIFSVCLAFCHFVCGWTVDILFVFSRYFSREKFSCFVASYSSTFV